jgi:NAD(P)-dependent dehydrogenase (short-subunit alcohol dehydrogenase family)
MKNWQYKIFGGSPPSPMLQSINDLMHEEPFSIIASGVIWFLILMCAPFVAFLLLFWTLFRLVLYLIGYSTNKVDTSVQELSVIITGCDSGFGFDIAQSCHTKGYYVFCCCLKEDSLQMFEGMERIIPLVVDVSKEEDISKLKAVAMSWLSAKVGSKDRYLHAIVNNAGIGNFGLVDWIGLEDYSKNMEVNCMGQIRIVKAFIPFLKDQYASSEKSYQDARIVNMTSSAGLVAILPGASPYHASKFAAEGFSNALRFELRDFGIKVITLNPSFHDTPLTNGMIEQVRRQFDGAGTSIKERYGIEYLDQNIMPLLKCSKSVLWRRKNVLRDLSRSVDLINPSTRYITGIDAKFCYPLLRMFPDFVQEFFIPRFLHPPKFFTRKEKGE